MKVKAKKIFQIAVYIFAFIGFFLTAGYIAVRLGLTNTVGIVIDTQSDFFKQNNGSANQNSKTTLPFAQDAEWTTFKNAVAKDSGIIEHVSAVTGVPSRIIVSDLVGEQLRLFYTDRPLFKAVFEPLKILGSESQFSWGINGIKEATAVQIEQNLASTTSPFYPGPQYARLLAFQTQDVNSERFNRIIDEHDHYWSYLYTALYIKEIETQWKSAGFDISKNPAILGTLFNIGFAHSTPNANPQIGGAEIDIGTTKYSFGSLASDFYYSDELTDLFPRQ